MILDMPTYLNGMKKSLNEKLFFVDKVNSNLFVDYGCADGILLKSLYSMNPEYKYYGYDISNDMLTLARQDCNYINFTDCWNSINLNDSSTLILSSIIHEVYSYGSSECIKEFWDRVLQSNFKYIVIRDMMLNNEVKNKSVGFFTLFKIHSLVDKKLLQEFVNRWGSLEREENFIHFLLKYRFKSNWSREVNENYLPITVEQLLGEIPRKYKITYQEHHLPYFIKDNIKKEFDIDLQDSTHLKLILERR